MSAVAYPENTMICREHANMCCLVTRSVDGGAVSEVNILAEMMNLGQILYTQQALVIDVLHPTSTNLLNCESCNEGKIVVERALK